MGIYYVDRRIMEVVKDLDTTYLPPELYYKYLRGINDWQVIETYQDKNGLRLYFTWDINHKENINSERDAHFKRRNFEYCTLYSYTVPTTWFDEETEGL
jgi:hypothetical protein